MPRYEWKAKVVVEDDTEEQARAVAEDTTYAINKGDNLRVYLDGGDPEVEDCE